MARPKKTGQVVTVEKTWLSKEEAKKYLGCSERFLQTLRENALVTFKKYGNKMYWYELASIERFLNYKKETSIL